MSFLVQSVPLPGEPLLGGYLVRLCENNQLPKLSWLFDLIEEKTGVRVKSSLELVQHPMLLEALERLIPTPKNALQRLGWTHLHSALGDSYRIDREELYESLLMIRHGQVCPLCLAESGMAREEWVFGHVPVCAQHGVALIDTCPSCHRAISNDRFSMGHCHSCGGRFQDAEVQQVKAATKNLAGSLLKHQGLLLGHAGNCEELNLNEGASLFLLICSVLKPYAKPMYVPPRCDGMSSKQRIAGFEILASAWNDDHLDSSRVRGVLSMRWPYLERISETLLAQRLGTFLVGRKLHMLIGNAILADDPEGAIGMAAHQPHRQMPYIENEADAAAYLGVSVREFNDYQMATGCLSKTAEDWCYDADELIAARTLLDEALSDSELDEFLGLNGAVKTLQNMGLIKPWSVYAPVERKYAPWDIQALYDQMWTRVIHSESATPLISLGDLVHQLEMDEPGAALMSRVLNQDLPIRDWQRPYRLSDIWVEKAAVSLVFHGQSF